MKSNEETGPTAATSEENVISSLNPTIQEARTRLGTEAIELLASGLNLAAHTIEEYSHNTIDEENLKQLNDEQLLRLLEEAYHSKKLDEKNKSAIFKEILEDVHESLATPDNNKSKATTSSSQKNQSNKKQKNAFDSIAALNEIMDSSSNVTIPAATSSTKDPDADTSSTKTEVEEMELDQFSDLEDNLRAHENARKLDENGNPTPSSGCSSSCNNSVSYTARQLKPLSIYRHNPAFHSQHVSVNQMDEIPPLSPTALQPTVPLKEENNRVIPAAKARRKKKAVKTEDSIKAEEIDGYRGGDDLESLLQFIGEQPQQPQQPLISATSKSKRSRRVDRKSKRSRTPSVTGTPNKEKSPSAEVETVSQKTSRASSASNVPDSVTTVKNSLIVVNNNSGKKTLKKPKKPAGWLVDFNNDEKSSKVKAKPPSGKIIAVENNKKEESAEVLSETNSISEQELIINRAEETTKEEFTQVNQDEKQDEDVCFNYASILKFIKQEWDIVTMEISNGSNDIQSKSLSVTPTDRHRLIPGSPAPQSMTQSIPDQGHTPLRHRRNMPQSPKINVSSVDEDSTDECSDFGEKVLEMKGMGVAVSHPMIELGKNKPSNPPMPHLSAKASQLRSLASSSGSLSSVSSNESNVNTGSRRPPTSLSVLSATSLAEVTKTIRERHSSLDGGLSPPPRVVSLEDSRGFKVMTELVNHDVLEDKKKNLSSRYTPLKPINKK